MKKILFAIPVWTILLVSCSKQDVTPAISASIVGKWYSVTDTTWTSVNGKITGTQVYNLIQHEYDQYNADGTGQYFAGGNHTGTFTYTLSGSSLTIDIHPTLTTNAYQDIARIASLSIKKLDAHTLIVSETIDITGVSANTSSITTVSYYSR